MLFSQRKGLKPVKSVIQIDDIDMDLRTGLWNALTLSFWNQVHSPGLLTNDPMDVLVKRIWMYHFKKPLDSLYDFWNQNLSEIKAYFFDCQWYEVYDFIEFIANNYPDEDESINWQFRDFCNSILKLESSAYRFVGGRIAQITAQVEISEIEEALQITKILKGVSTHLKTALEMFSDRKAPNYRNSMKESISAVEAICNLITKEKKATLSDALKKVEGKIALHPALKIAFEKLYAYTCDKDGIRHALHDEPNLDSEDAKFFLVACSAFVNYLIAKSSKVGIKL
jgi:hypothetical protein